MKIIDFIKSFFEPTDQPFDLSLSALMKSIDAEIEENEMFFNLSNDNDLLDILIYKNNYLQAYKSYVIKLMKKEYYEQKELETSVKEDVVQNTIITKPVLPSFVKTKIMCKQK